RLQHPRRRRSHRRIARHPGARGGSAVSAALDPRTGGEPWPSRFDGRVVLVTGAAGGLGGAAAQRLAAEGATVVSTDLAYAADSLGDTGAELRLDVTEPHQWASVVERVVEHY